jgi:putative ABC transport system ATP-binding protein
LGKDIANLDDPQRAALRRGTVGVVFQQFNLIPSLNVAANLSFHARLSRSEDKLWTEHLAHYLGLGSLLDRFPEQLSGGQQQRVAIGRTLAARPALILADEPTGNLDEATADVVMNLLLELVQESGAGLLMVTHSLRLAKRLDHQVNLQAGIIG